MNTTLRKCLLGTCFAGGMIVLSATAASAADTTSGNDGILSGTQVVAPVSAPINLNATSVGILGNSSSTASGAAHSASAATSPAAPAASTSGSHSIGSGTQVIAPITVPISLGSSSVGLLGGSTATSSAPPAASPSTSPTPASTTSGNGGVGSGTQVIAPVTVPITVGATSVGVLGNSSARSVPASEAPAVAPSAPATAPGQATTSGGESIASGAQVVAPISVPVNLGATAVGVLGDLSATAAPALPSTQAPAGATSGSTTSGNEGVLSGSQIVLPITVPITIGATSVGIGGESTSTVNPPLVTPPVVAPPVVNPPVVTPPVVAAPVVSPPTAGITTAALVTRSAPTGMAATAQGAAAAAVPAAVGSSVPLASTGLNHGLVILAGAMVLMGLLLTALGRRKAAASRC